jgi:hypothetical protein
VELAGARPRTEAAGQAHILIDQMTQQAMEGAGPFEDLEEQGVIPHSDPRFTASFG